MAISQDKQWELLAALYKHGTNIEALAKAVPDLGPSKVEHLIKCWKLNAKRRNIIEETRDDIGSMKHWQHHTENIQMLQGTHHQGIRKGRSQLSRYPKDHALLLNKVVRYLTEKEEHPPRSSSTDPDYAEIYRYLAQVLTGEAPSEMSQGSAAKVIEILTKIERIASQSYHKGKLNRSLQLNRPYHTASGSKKTSKARSRQDDQEAEGPECSLFTDDDDDEAAPAEGQSKEEEITHLHKDDLHYELKKKKALKQCTQNQLAMASRLTELPGLNPFGLMPRQLVKPQHLNEQVLDNY